MSVENLQVRAVRAIKGRGGAWTCQTYIHGHLLTTCRRGHSGIISSAQECTRTINKASGWIGYTFDMGIDAPYGKSQARAMAVGNYLRATRSRVENVHRLGLLKLIQEHETLQGKEATA